MTVDAKGFPLLDLSIDEVLTTTRAVRKRLDTTRPVPRALIEECLEIAFQAPNGSNMNTWQWIVVEDRALMKEIERIYVTAMDELIVRMGGRSSKRPEAQGIERIELIGASVDALRENMHKMPAAVIPLMGARVEKADVFSQASQYGSIIQAVWSFNLALRARGLGSAWTTAHLVKEAELAELLGIPMDKYTQVGIFPVAYTIGTDFKKAFRKPLNEVVSWNKFGQRG